MESGDIKRNKAFQRGGVVIHLAALSFISEEEWPLPYKGFNTAYVASLQKLAEHCAFGDSLADMLRDRLVCGIRDECVQKRLLTKSDLTFAKTLEIAEVAERAKREAAELHEGVSEVHKIPAHNPKRPLTK